MSKLQTTPDSFEKKNLVGGAVLFQLPTPAHLIVLERGKLPRVVEDMFGEIVRTYYWAPEDLNQSYGNHAHSVGQEIFLGLTGRIKVTLHDGDEENIVHLRKGDALFIPCHLWHIVEVVEQGSSMMVHSDAIYDRERHYQENFATFCRLKQQAT